MESDVMLKNDPK